jgi:hypothetical protein
MKEGVSQNKGKELQKAPARAAGLFEETDRLLQRLSEFAMRVRNSGTSCQVS